MAFPLRIGEASARRAILGAGLFSALLLAVKFLFPGGTPNGVVLQGTISGLILGTTAVGIVLIYRTSRIVNFAQAALGALGAAFTYNLITALHWPYPLAFATGVLVAALVGIAAELILRRFFNAPRLVVTVATLGIAGLATQYALTVNFLPLWGDDPRGVVARFGGELITPLAWFRWTVRPFDFEFSHLLSLIIVPLCFVGVALFLRRTQIGTAVRAAAENVPRAEMLGVNVKLLSTVVWGIAGALAGVGVILRSTNTGFAVAADGAPAVLLVALAAAILAGLRSIPIAVAAAVGLSIIESTLGYHVPDHADSIASVINLAIIGIGLLLVRKTRLREREESSWDAISEVRPLPRELLGVPSIRTWRSALIGIAVGAVVLFPWVATTAQTNTGGMVAISAIVLLSIYVLTGWTGQVSLGQWAFVAVGALVGGALTSKVGIPFWAALPLGAVITAGITALVGIPALRIRGLMLAVLTFALASVTFLVLFNERWFGWLHPANVERPTFLLLDFEDERSMYYLSIVVAAGVVVLLRTLRRGRPGRILLALRENEEDLTAMGINPVRMRLAAFALSGFLCGIAGVLFAHHQRAVTAGSFTPMESLEAFIWATIGGFGTMLGPIIGALLMGLFSLYGVADPVLAFFLNPYTGVLIMLYLFPTGVAGMLYAVRDTVLRIVAQRQGIVVPSLFADVDTEALERRLVPLAEADEGETLAAITGGARYRLRSVFHAAGNGGRGEAHAPDDREAMKAAAAGLTEGGFAGVAAAPAAATPTGGPHSDRPPGGGRDRG